MADLSPDAVAERLEELGRLWVVAVARRLEDLRQLMELTRHLRLATRDPGDREP